MHSSRIRTVRCSDCWVGGVSQHALGRECIPACSGQGCVYPSTHGGCLPRGRRLPRGVYTPLPCTEFLTACENFTFQQLRFRTVMNS